MKKIILAVLTTATLSGCNLSKEVCTNRHSIDNGEKVWVVRHGTYFKCDKKRTTLIRLENSDNILNKDCVRVGDTIIHTDIVNGRTITNKYYNE